MFDRVIERALEITMCDWAFLSAEHEFGIRI